MPSPARPVWIADAAAAAALLADLRGGPCERAAVLFLDPERRLLGRIDVTGSRTAVAPPLRAVIAAALRFDAALLILAHTHPSGHPLPSAADVAYTRALGQVAAPLDLTLVDHLILAGDATTSFRECGLL